MGMWSDWYSRNAGKENSLVNVEFVLKNIDTHTHDDRYYIETEINTKLTEKSDTGHTHDDRYYSRIEVDAGLATKATILHTHDDTYAKLSGAVFTGNISAPSYTATSSRAVKKNIKLFKKSALAIIRNVDIVSFKYKKSEDSILQIGFIAEDTDPLLSGKDQKGMRINTTIGLLLKAVQELNQKVETLEKELYNRNTKHLIPKEKKR